MKIFVKVSKLPSEDDRAAIVIGKSAYSFSAADDSILIYSRANDTTPLPDLDGPREITSEDYNKMLTGKYDYYIAANIFSDSNFDPRAYTSKTISAKFVHTTTDVLEDEDFSDDAETFEDFIVEYALDNTSKGTDVNIENPTYGVESKYVKAIVKSGQPLTASELGVNVQIHGTIYNGDDVIDPSVDGLPFDIKAVVDRNKVNGTTISQIDDDTYDTKYPDPFLGLSGVITFNLSSEQQKSEDREKETIVYQEGPSSDNEFKLHIYNFKKFFDINNSEYTASYVFEDVDCVLFAYTSKGTGKAIFTNSSLESKIESQEVSENEDN